MRTFSHWGSLVPESCVYFKLNLLKGHLRFFKYSRQIIVSYSFSLPILDGNKGNCCQRRED